MNNLLLDELEKMYLQFLACEDEDVFERDSPAVLQYKNKIAQLTSEEYNVFLDMLGKHEQHTIQDAYDEALRNSVNRHKI
jgi:hypothetical protein